MSKKVFIGVGHGGSDPGAVANGLRESDINLVVANACREELERHGVEVKMSRYKDENDPVSEEIKECNAYGPNLAIDVHTNAGGGDGFEAFYYSNGGTSKVLAQNIEAEVKNIGQNSRGCKTRLNSAGQDYYAFIRNTYAPAVILECAFIDNKTDVQIIDTIAEQKVFGVAYAKGILKTLGIAYKSPTSSVYTVKILADALNVRNGPGTSYKINTTVKKNEVYTIVAENNNFGQLKSGAGWISLNSTYVSKN
ncbi:MAG: N-acetylmuramoyl-L-alanine amidase [Paraclostridium sp.]